MNILKLTNQENINCPLLFKIEHEDPADESNRLRDANFYNILAGGSKMKLMEAFLELKIPELLGREYKMTSEQICQRLNLHNTRGWKLLHLLSLSKFLIEESDDNYDGNMNDFTYRMSDESISCFGRNGQKGFFFRDLITDWKDVNKLGELQDIVLKDSQIQELHTWPPRTKKDSEVIFL
jgi:hypothetical protein